MRASFSACLSAQLIVDTMQQEWWTAFTRNVRCEDSTRPQLLGDNNTSPLTTPTSPHRNGVARRQTWSLRRTSFEDHRRPREEERLRQRRSLRMPPGDDRANTPDAGPLAHAPSRDPLNKSTCSRADSSARKHRTRPLECVDAMTPVSLSISEHRPLRNGRADLPQPSAAESDRAACAVSTSAIRGRPPWLRR